MNQRTMNRDFATSLARALGSSHAALLMVLIAVFVVPNSSFARDSQLLNQAVDSSNSERASVERDYRVESHLSRKGDAEEVRSMHVEIGDELGAENDSGGPPAPAHLNADNTYNEKGVSKRLDREWKEVNRGMQETSRVAERTPRAGSSSSISPSGRSSGSSSTARGRARTRQDDF